MSATSYSQTERNEKLSICLPFYCVLLSYEISLESTEKSCPKQYGLKEISEKIGD